MLYDIRDEEKAVETLERLTGVPAVHWIYEKYKNIHRSCWSDASKDIERIIKIYGGKYPSLDEIEVVVVHLTTSNNGCSTILKNGIIDLCKVYNDTDSELRGFLEKYGVEILIDLHQLKYNEQSFDISFGECPSDDESTEYFAWSIGRKFYYDFTVCGFLAISRRYSYNGNVHKRPEILWDMDNLLKTNFQEIWEETHQAYEVIFKAPVAQIVYSGESEVDEKQRVMCFLVDAYRCASRGPSMEEVLCHNGVEIFPQQILECNEFHLWD